MDKAKPKFKEGDKVKFDNPYDDGVYIILDYVFVGKEIRYSLSDRKSSYEQSLILVETKEVEAPVKYDNNKPRLDLIRPEFTLALGEVLAYGADKYEEPVGEVPNYLKGDGFNYSRIIGSLERHIAEFKMGVNVDPESSKHHLAHAAANIMFLLTYELSDKGIDDRIVLQKEKDE
jgi:hypothetical protein